MGSFLYLLGLLAAVGCGMVLVASQSAVHEGVAAVLGLAAICAFGFGRCITVLEEIAKTAASADLNNWTVNKSILKQLRDPNPNDPEPRADGDNSPLPTKPRILVNVPNIPR